MSICTNIELFLTKGNQYSLAWGWITIGLIKYKTNIMRNKKGEPFASIPQQQGKGKDEQGNEVTKYYNQVDFIDDETKFAVQDEIIKEFNKLLGTIPVEKPTEPQPQKEEPKLEKKKSGILINKNRKSE